MLFLSRYFGFIVHNLNFVQFRSFTGNDLLQVRGAQRTVHMRISYDMYTSSASLIKRHIWFQASMQCDYGTTSFDLIKLSIINLNHFNPDLIYENVKISTIGALYRTPV